MPGRAVATAAVLLGMLVAAATSASPAAAGLRGTGAGTETVGSGSFAVVPTLLSTGIPSPASLPLTFALGVAPVPQYFSAVNTGSITVSAAGYSVVVVGGIGGTTSVTLTACVGASWNQALGTCAGTTTTIGSWTSASSAAISSTAVPAAAAARLSLKASVTGGSLTSVTSATVNISVSSGPTRQIRAATTVDS
ncbi:MAG: hypothetical protein QOH29_623 [Actinomycetota bacterium]|nr:hypothetical protein [Actinomycetota bacterium]